MGSTYKEDLRTIRFSVDPPNNAQLFLSNCTLTIAALFGRAWVLNYLWRFKNYKTAQLARIIIFSSYYSSSGPLLQELGWDNLSVPRIKLFAIKIKVYNSMAPSLNTYAQKFWKWGPIMILGTPFLNFNCLFPKPIMAKKRSGYMGAYISNKLPEDLRGCKAMNFFQSKLDRLLPSLFDSLL